jgi:hypothetical protein
MFLWKATSPNTCIVRITYKNAKTLHMNRTVIMGKLHFDVWAKETMVSSFLKSVHKNHILIRKTETINKTVNVKSKSSRVWGD